MKTTLAYLLTPQFDHYRSIGELARALQYLVSSAKDFRDPGRWGESGPHEYLVNYGGCVNCQQRHWHSGRISGYGDVTSWQENHDALYKCILSALCQDSPAHLRWRNRHDIGLNTRLKFPMAYQNKDHEVTAWKQFESLHRHQLPVSTLNDCHRRVNVLAEPELCINGTGIWMDCSVTQKSEMRLGQAYSRWHVCFLLRHTKKWSRAPRWDPGRETFADFTLRAALFYKSVRP